MRTSISRGVAAALVLLCLQDEGAAAAEPAPSSPTPTASPSGAPADQPAAVVTLEALLAWAHTHAPAAALDSANDARIRAAQAAAGPPLPDNPQLGVGVGPRISGPDVGLDFEVSLSQRFEVGGERDARLHLAQATRARIEAESADRWWDLHTTLHALFFRALIARQRVVLAGKVVTFQDDITDIVAKRHAAGEAALLSERIARAEAATARQKLAAAQQGEWALRQDLALYSGWPEGDAPPIVAGSLSAVPGLQAVAELAALARHRRTDVALLTAALEEAKRGVRAADLDKTPEPTVGLSWARESAPSGGDSNHIVIASLSLPLPFVSHNQAERAAARAEVSVVQAQLARLDAEITAQVARAHRAATAAQARLQAYGSDVLPQFEENLTALRRAYELGGIDILGLASGRERFLAVQEDALTAQEDYFTALAELEHAVGVDIIHDGGEQ